MKQKFSKFFSPDNVLILRNYRGERRLHFSGFHRLLFGFIIFFFGVMSVFLTASFIMDHFVPSNQAELTQTMRDDYEGRIEELIKERDNLSNALEASQSNSERLITSLGNQQELLFELERENYELTNNLDSLRTNLVASQNRLDALNLQIETQRNQIASMETGGAADTSTLSTITATLAETAQARDEARAQVQTLRQQIAVDQQNAESAARKRDVLFAQIEEAIETSLVPMKASLSKTGLNIDSLLNNIRRNSSIGGLNVDADLSVLSSSPEGVARIEEIVDGLDELASLSYLAQTLPIGKPVKSGYRMTSGFGYRRHPISGRTKLHAGQDMAGPVGTPIYATGNGKVIHAGWNSGYGKTIKIQHANGIKTLYGHLSRIRVSVGDNVKLGQRIGDMGNTGRSTGSHLHYEVIVNGQARNPSNFLRASNYVQ